MPGNTSGLGSDPPVVTKIYATKAGMRIQGLRALDPDPDPDPGKKVDPDPDPRI